MQLPAKQPWHRLDVVFLKLLAGQVVHSAGLGPVQSKQPLVQGWHPLVDPVQSEEL